MKKIQQINFGVIPIAVFILLVLVGIVGVLFEIMNSFDPDKHICLDTVRACDGMTTEQIELLLAGEINLTCYDKCLDWRPKTFCELHPDNTNYCVCEEWHEQKINCLSDASFIFHNEFENFTYVVNVTNGETKKCYVVDPFKVYIQSYVTSYSDGGRVDEVSYTIDVDFREENIKTCQKAHRKTIADLSCTELRDYFEHGRECTGVPPHRVCNYPNAEVKLSIRWRENILYHMMLKNCTG